MKISYIREMSDLHGEFYGKKETVFLPPELPTDSETVLLLSGDVHVGARAIKSGWMKILSERFAYVMYVLGNHEHYTESVDRTADKIRAALVVANITNVVVMDNKVFEIPGANVKVIGGTMWTDFNKGHPVSMWEASRNMKDYKKIRNHLGSHPFNTQTAARLHSEFKSFLIDELAKPFDGYVIVMTHHAPHQLSIHPMYANDYHSNGAYASDLSDIILDHSQIKYWFHGHMHNNSYYNIGDDCLVVCNPFGYHGHEVNDSFDPVLRIQL
jgi:hypothetical protein